MSYQVKDELLTKTAALPNGAATTTSAAIQLQGASTVRDFIPESEVLLTAPALTVTELADTQTITYTIETSDDSAFGSGVTTISTTLVQTGAGGVGAVTNSLRVSPNTQVKSYIRGKAVKTGASNASTSSFTVAVLT